MDGVAVDAVVILTGEYAREPGICPGKEDCFVYTPPLNVQYVTVAKEVLL